MTAMRSARRRRSPDVTALHDIAEMTATNIGHGECEGVRMSACVGRRPQPAIDGTREINHRGNVTAAQMAPLALTSCAIGQAPRPPSQRIDRRRQPHQQIIGGSNP